MRAVFPCLLLGLLLGDDEVALPTYNGDPEASAILCGEEGEEKLVA